MTNQETAVRGTIGILVANTLRREGWLEGGGGRSVMWGGGCQQSTGTHNASISAAVVGASDHDDGASDDHEPRQHDEADADGVLTSFRVLSVVEVGDAARQQQEDRDAPTR